MYTSKTSACSQNAANRAAAHTHTRTPHHQLARVIGAAWRGHPLKHAPLLVLFLLGDIGDAQDGPCRDPGLLEDAQNVFAVVLGHPFGNDLRVLSSN